MRRGLAASRELAREMVQNGVVLVSGAVATKPARLVDPSEPIVLAAAQPRWASRGARKLAGALDEFGIDPAGRRCLDVGASAGGFTDLLLDRGAEHVVAVDVGRGQLDWRLRRDPRVTSMERTDVRDLEASHLGAFGLVVADLSFISLRTVMPALAALARGADLVVLVKPQFEVGRAAVGRGGIVHDPALRDRAAGDVSAAAAAAGLATVGAADSVLAGTDGNVERFLHLREAGS